MKIILIIFTLITLLSSCSKNQEAMVKPESTKVNGNISELIEIVDGEYKVSIYPNSGYANWQIQVKLKKLKDAHDFNYDRTKPSANLHVTDEKGLPITNFKEFNFENGETYDNMVNFLNFLNDKKDSEAWFTFYCDSRTEELPEDACKFNLRIDVENAEYILNDLSSMKTTRTIETIRASIFRADNPRDAFNLTNDFYTVAGQPYNLKASSSMNPSKNITYVAQNIHDFDVNTGWSPDDTKGNGIGETIEMTFTPANHNVEVNGLIVYHGYFKGNGDLYEANSRIKTMKMYYMDEAVAILEFEDFNYPQSFSIESIELNGGNFKNEFKFEIIDVYSGNKYDDLVVSEILFTGGESTYDDIDNQETDFGYTSDDEVNTSPSNNCEEALEDYESFVDDYIKFIESASSGDYSAMTKAVPLMQKAESAGNKIQNMGQIDLGSDCWNRYLRIQKKLTTAALKMAKNMPKNLDNMKDQMKSLEDMLPK
jgi:hypothetical protein